MKKDLHKAEETSQQTSQAKEDKVDAESSESTTPSTSSSCDKSSKGHDFSSDEAKESEGDPDPVEVNNKANEADSCTNVAEAKVKYSCDICNVTVNSATQLSQVLDR